MKKDRQENRNVPNLRFGGFDDGWQGFKLNQILNEHKSRNLNNDYSEVFSVAKQSGVVNQIEHLGRSYASSDISNYKIVFPNDVVYTKSPTAGFPFGIVKQNMTNRTGVVSVLYAVFKPINKELGRLLDFYFLSPIKTYNYLVSLVHKGAKNTMNISNSVFLNGKKIYLPKTNQEQKKIIKFLALIEKRIETQNKITQHLESLITGYRQKIFSQEIRFENEKGNKFSEWEEIKLLEITERIKKKNSINNQNVLTISAKLGLVSQLEYFNKSVSAKTLTSYYLLDKNDFAYNKSYSKGYPMGAIKRLNRYDNGVVSTLYICFKFKETISLDFMEHYFNSGMQNKELEKVAQEGARNHGLLNIGINDFFGISLKIPSFEEQTKIANFLSSLDKKLKKEQEILEQYQQQKKYLLQNLFI